MQILDLSANSFDQRLRENIGKVLPYLKHLNLSNNGFQWILPSSFGEMKDIKFLDLSHNNFSGSLPMEFLIGCYSLHTLKLSYNKFFGQIFPKPTNFGSLVVLIANNNLFTGIADGLLNSKSLGVLDLSNNYLQGVIPSWFGGFFSPIFSSPIIFWKVPCQVRFSTYLHLKFWNFLEISFRGTYLRNSMV